MKNNNPTSHNSDSPLLNFRDSPIDISDRVGQIMCDVPQHIGTQELKDKIKQFLALGNDVSDENIALEAVGTANILYNLVKKMLPKGTMVGEWPQFYSFPEEYVASGGKYLGISCEHGLPGEQILKIIENDPSIVVVYLNNPNNPTGQVWDPSMLERIIQVADKKGMYVIVDEAYVDLLPASSSCASKVLMYKKLIVLRSFSKNLGLGLRNKKESRKKGIGYMFADKDIIDTYVNTCHPVKIANENVSLAAHILGDQKFLDDAKQQCVGMKHKTIAMLEDRGFTLRPTDDSVPILVVQHDAIADIKDFFGKRGLFVQPGEVFHPLNPSLSTNFVRIRVPSDDESLRQLMERLYLPLA